MATKMKGLLKGLRYISNIFEADEKEPEMQIGFPTDVKHVAHIGWDGPSINATPSWMNEFKSTSSEPLVGTATGERNQRTLSFSSPSQDVRILNCNSTRNSSSPGDLPGVPLPKPSRSRNPSTSSSMANPGSPRTRHSRNHQSSRSTTTNSPDHDKSEGSRRSRRERSATAGSTTDIVKYTSSTSSSPPSLRGKSQDPSKQSRRRKVKGSTSSSKSPSSSRSKAVDQQEQLPPLMPMREEEEEG